MNRYFKTIQFSLFESDLNYWIDAISSIINVGPQIADTYKEPLTRKKFFDLTISKFPLNPRLCQVQVAVVSDS